MNSEPGATTACTNCESPSPLAVSPCRLSAYRSRPGSSCSDFSSSAGASTSRMSPESIGLSGVRSSRRTPSRNQPSTRTPKAFCRSDNGRVAQRESFITSNSVR